MKQDIYKHTNEKQAIFIGKKNAQFAPDMAGISYIDRNYEIERVHGDYFYVFEYIISGRGYIQENNRSYEVHAGDAYILRPNTYQHYRSDKDDPWTKVWFNVYGSFVRHMLSDYSLESTVVFPGVQNGEFLLEIVRAIENNPISSSDQIAVLLLKHIQTLAASLNAGDNSSQAALAVKQYIEEHLTQPLSIDEVANHVHLSRSRVLHLFKEVYNITPYQYYSSLKMELAISLLTRTPLSITEISDQLGFNGCQHFSSAFKKHYGMSPAAYRRNSQ